MRPSGIKLIDALPWGTHFCQFYQTTQDLTEILVPYFKAGLANNEFCMWITAHPLSVEAAQAALAHEVPDLDQYLNTGQIEFLDYRHWYTPDEKFDPDRVMRAWVEKLEAARQRGFAGLRLTSNTSWLEASDWQAFNDHETTVNGAISRYPILALYSFSLAKCGAGDILDAVSHHAFALIKRGHTWEVIENKRQKKLETSLQESERRYRSLFDQMSEGFALHEIILDDQGSPCDYRFLEINPAFEHLTGLRRVEVLGKRMKEVLLGEDPTWVARYGEVALTVQSQHFDHYSSVLKRHYDVLAYCPMPGQFAVLFQDVTDRKLTEESLRHQADILATVNDAVVGTD